MLYIFYLLGFTMLNAFKHMEQMQKNEYTIYSKQEKYNIIIECHRVYLH